MNRNFKISSASKKMIDSLLWMEENESKYDLLKKEDYKEYFVSAQREFEANLYDILRIGPEGSGAIDPWEALYRSYEAQFSGNQGDAVQDEAARTPLDCRIHYQ